MQTQRDIFSFDCRDRSVTYETRRLKTEDKKNRSRNKQEEKIKKKKWLKLAKEEEQWNKNK